MLTASISGPHYPPKAATFLHCSEPPLSASALNRCAIARFAGGLAVNTVSKGEILGSGWWALS